MGKIPIAELLELSVEERIQLVQDLWDSIAAQTVEIPLTDAQKDELERRWQKHERDPDTASPWPVVRERLLKKYG